MFDMCLFAAAMLTGYSTRDALRILRSELEDQLNHYTNKRARLPLFCRLHQCFLHQFNARSVLHVTSIAVIVISVFLIVVAYVSQTHRYHVMCYHLLLNKYCFDNLPANQFMAREIFDWTNCGLAKMFYKKLGVNNLSRCNN